MAAPVVTVIFVSIHLNEVVHYLPALIALTLCSTSVLVARIVTRSLAPSIVIHAGYNLGLGVMVYALPVAAQWRRLGRSRPARS